jgi:hypothetical protein
MLLLLTGSLAFAVVGFFVARKDPLVGYACVVFFGLCALVGAIGSHPRSSFLELTPEGFAFCVLFRRSFVPWRDVREFLPIKIHHNSMVGWNYSAGFESRARARRISTALSRAEAALPDTYGMKAADLSALLNEVLARHSQ